MVWFMQPLPFPRENISCSSDTLGVSHTFIYVRIKCLYINLNCSLFQFSLSWLRYSLHFQPHLSKRCENILIFLQSVTGYFHPFLKQKHQTGSKPVAGVSIPCTSVWYPQKAPSVPTTLPSSTGWQISTVSLYTWSPICFGVLISSSLCFPVSEAHCRLSMPGRCCEYCGPRVISLWLHSRRLTVRVLWHCQLWKVSLWADSPSQFLF